MIMPAFYTLAIDQGTHSTRAVVFDETGHIIAQEAMNVSLHTFGSDKVEQDAEEILASMMSVIQSVLDHSDVDPALIKQAGLAVQRSSMVAWNRHTGEALSSVLSWQDQRSAAWSLQFTEEALAIRRRTGLRLSPYYGAGKMHWLLSNNPDVNRARQADSLIIGPLASYLLYHLLETREAVVDEVNASRTLLWNLYERQWDPWLFELFGLDKSLLPQCLPVCSEYGYLRDYHIPLTAVNGDQSAAIYANGNPDPNKLVINIGTGAFVLLPLPEKAIRDLPETYPLLKGISMSGATYAEYFLEGTINGAGSALSWIKQQKAIDVDDDVLSGWFESVKASPMFVNTVGGLGTPWCWTGPEPAFLDRSIEDIAPSSAFISVIESIVFLVQLNIDLFKGVNADINGIMLSGGVSSMDGLCQRLANLSGYRVFRSDDMEATARGIAWQSANCPNIWQAAAGKYFEPEQDDLLRNRYEHFRQVMSQLADHNLPGTKTED
ncbi:MAG: hypothetical protein EP297_05630 [Gammaproteobacteria bacterium]|nr:MAG: hypothetical protein EP297_05630 [Gammaproteobacteria bacterium]